MTIEEKKTILYKHCGTHGCEECPLNGKNLWRLAEKDKVDCLPIDESPESDLDKALELIGYGETPTKPTDSPIKDSGERREFTSGAVRDMSEGKGDMASVPWESILRLSRHYENGAKKYARWNFRKGIPLSSFIDSACRHLAKYQCGCDDEDHLSAAAFNILGAMLMENTKPEMIDLPLREGKKTFGYFEEDAK